MKRISVMLGIIVPPNGELNDGDCPKCRAGLCMLAAARSRRYVPVLQLTRHPRSIAMKRIVLAIALVSLPAGAGAQSNQDLIEGALAAAPTRAREATAVVRWNADYTYETIKEGTNQLVCYDRSDERGRRPFAVQCTSVANLPRVAQNRRFRGESSDRTSEQALVAAAVKDGTREPGQYGSVWYRMEGDDRSSAGIHTTILVPGATTASTGLPEDRNSGGAYIMAAGTDAAHIMVPGR